ncbi:hypothetical protein ABZ749_01560 [Micromonospora sp. NPDC047753]|uniref:hypothetical protein n=1 Tax=Micromonospora sp. NPDC047753 TaxID=3154817 RepID=UPI0033E9181F
MIDPMYEVIHALDFDGLPIGARPRMSPGGQPMSREAGWVAFWPAEPNRWMVEFARPSDQEHLFLRFRLGGVVQIWPPNNLALPEDGWIKAPSTWDSGERDLRAITEETLDHLQLVSPSQVDLVRTRLQSAVDAERPS